MDRSRHGDGVGKEGTFRIRINWTKIGPTTIAIPDDRDIAFILQVGPVIGLPFVF